MPTTPRTTSSRRGLLIGASVAAGATTAELAAPDRFAAIKHDYLLNGADPSNLRYGYVRAPG